MAGVTSSYPAALDSESNLTPPNNGDTLSVADHWLAGNSGPIVAIETELGTDPAGTFTDVKSRLDDVDDKVITEIDQWVLTSTLGSQTGTIFITSNWSNTASTMKLKPTTKGLGLNESSGVFSFQSTGYYLVTVTGYFNATVNGNANFGIYVTNDDTNYTLTHFFLDQASSGTMKASVPCLLKISDTSNDKFKVYFDVPGTYSVIGSLTRADTIVNCIKLGEL